MSHFDAFVPSLVRTRLAKVPSAVWHHSAETFEAPVLFADLSGFSILAEQLAERGPGGVEDLKDLLNLFFGRLQGRMPKHQMFPDHGSKRRVVFRLQMLATMA